MCQSELDEFVHCHLAVRRSAWGKTELEASARLNTGRKLEVWASGTVGELPAAVEELEHCTAALSRPAAGVITLVAVFMFSVLFSFVAVGVFEIAFLVRQSRKNANMYAGPDTFL